MKFNKKTAKKKLDKLWSECVRAKFKRCQWCGKKEGKLDAHHIITKSRSGYVGRWNLQNSILLCFYCHRGKAHGSYQVEYSDFIRRWLSKQDLDYDQLKETYDGAVWKLNKGNYEIKSKILKEVLKFLKNEV